ncbi:MAG TPA: aspartate/glutamate racemase family protein [Verrucomicrobiae bacterium]|nr:aspartate/glutamate racemase family protein [Verrucomicrobiae bacterium]
MIGLFDSGLGGLTVLRRVRERLPRADVVFFADQAHVPYGDRTHDDLLRLLRANLAWLDACGVGVIAMACNTSCAIAERYGWPPTAATVLDLIDAAAIAVERGGYKRVGVVATAATVGAGSYGRRLRARIPGIDVVELPAPALVPLVEAGKLEGDEPRDAVAHLCAGLPLDLDAVVYGCTHYPALAPLFEAELGPDVALVDPAVVQAERVAELVSERNGSASTRYATSGEPAILRAGIARLTAVPDAHVERIAIPL